jgi:hypothetical protein
LDTFVDTHAAASDEPIAYALGYKTVALCAQPADGRILPTTGIRQLRNEYQRKDLQLCHFGTISVFKHGKTKKSTVV